jgi:hypothetical protein
MKVGKHASRLVTTVNGPGKDGMRSKLTKLSLSLVLSRAHLLLKSDYFLNELARACQSRWRVHGVYP